MSSLRIVYDNAADRATLTASSTAGSLAVTNLQSQVKSKVWRSTSTTVTLTATWSIAETVAVIALPFCTISPQGTARVRGYVLATDTTPVFDTGYVSIIPCDPLGNWTWGTGPLGVNSFAYGGGNYGRVWIPNPAQVCKVVIDIDDHLNTAGYIEAGRLVIGNYWNPSVVDVQNTTLQVIDTSSHTRTDSGDLYTYVGTKHRKQVLNLSSIEPIARKQLWNLMWNNGLSVPLFISLYPNNADGNLEAAHMLYGKLVTSPIMQTPYYNYNAATIEIEEV